MYKNKAAKNLKSSNPWRISFGVYKNKIMAAIGSVQPWRRYFVERRVATGTTSTKRSIVYVVNSTLAPCQRGDDLNEAPEFASALQNKFPLVEFQVITTDEMMAMFEETAEGVKHRWFDAYFVVLQHISTLPCGDAPLTSPSSPTSSPSGLAPEEPLLASFGSKLANESFDPLLKPSELKRRLLLVSIYHLEELDYIYAPIETVGAFTVSMSNPRSTFHLAFFKSGPDVPIDNFYGRINEQTLDALVVAYNSSPASVAHKLRAGTFVSSPTGGDTRQPSYHPSVPVLYNSAAQNKTYLLLKGSNLYQTYTSHTNPLPPELDLVAPQLVEDDEIVHPVFIHIRPVITVVYLTRRGHTNVLKSKLAVPDSDFDLATEFAAIRDSDTAASRTKRATMESTPPPLRDNHESLFYNVVPTARSASSSQRHPSIMLSARAINVITGREEQPDQLRGKTTKSKRVRVGDQLEDDATGSDTGSDASSGASIFAEMAEAKARDPIGYQRRYRQTLLASLSHLRKPVTH